MGHRREVSRVEGFSDAVFAFAITLLVVSLEVPKSFHELTVAMRGFLTFAVCFALLFQVWWRHYKFFRTYDLEDSYIVTLTAMLLFVVLFYVYPLKFLWSVVLAPIEGRRIGDDIMTNAQVPALFGIYGTGVIAVFSILALMHRHAYAKRDQLGLSAEEALEVRVRVYSNLGIASIGALSILVAFVTGRFAPGLVGLGGFVYFLIGVVEWQIGAYHDRQRRNIERISKASTAHA
jgi:uncharacterized membrane protein